VRVLEEDSFHVSDGMEWNGFAPMALLEQQWMLMGEEQQIASSKGGGGRWQGTMFLIPGVSSCRLGVRLEEIIFMFQMEKIRSHGVAGTAMDANGRRVPKSICAAHRKFQTITLCRVHHIQHDVIDVL
jgi:hypothetical protein